MNYKTKWRQTLIRKSRCNFSNFGANETTTTESAPSDEEVSAKNSSNSINEQTNVLVLCAGGGTSGLLANALNKAAEEYQVPVKAVVVVMVHIWIL